MGSEVANESWSSLELSMKLKWCQRFSANLESIPPQVNSIPLALLEKLKPNDASVIASLNLKNCEGFVYRIATYLNPEEYNTVVQATPLELLSMLGKRKQSYNHKYMLIFLLEELDPLPETLQRLKDAGVNFFLKDEDKKNDGVTTVATPKSHADDQDQREGYFEDDKEKLAECDYWYVQPYAKSILVALEKGRNCRTFETLLALTSTNLRDHKETLLWDSLINGNFPVFKYLAEKLLEISSQREFVGKATSWEHLVKFNLRWLGLNVNETNEHRAHLYENSLLYHVIICWRNKHRVQVTEMLIANGVRLTVERKRGLVDVLEMALISVNDIPLKLISLLEKRGGITSYHTAQLCFRQMAYMKMSSDWDFELWRELADDILLAHNVKLDQVEGYDAFIGSTLLHDATRNKFKAAIKYFLHKGLDINTRDEELRTPFFVAAVVSVDMMAYLLELGADPVAQDVYGRTPFHYAANGGSFSNAAVHLNFLIERKAYRPDSLLEILRWIVQCGQEGDHKIHKIFINFCLKEWRQHTLPPRLAMHLFRRAIDGRRPKNIEFLLKEFPPLLDKYLSNEDLREVVHMLVVGRTEIGDSHTGDTGSPSI